MGTVFQRFPSRVSLREHEVRFTRFARSSRLFYGLESRISLREHEVRFTRFARSSRLFYGLESRISLREHEVRFTRFARSSRLFYGLESRISLRDHRRSEIFWGLRCNRNSTRSFFFSTFHFFAVTEPEVDFSVCLTVRKT